MNATEAITLADLRTNAQELLHAVEVLEQHYANYEVRLVPKSIRPPRSTKAAEPNGQAKTGEKTMRDKVIDACRSKRTSLLSIVEETALSKRQVRGVLNSPDLKDNFERIEQDDGTKLYKFKG